MFKNVDENIWLFKEKTYLDTYLYETLPLMNLEAKYI